jgi:hypothetical protein
MRETKTKARTTQPLSMQAFAAVSRRLVIGIVLTLCASGAIAAKSLRLHPPENQALDFAALSRILETDSRMHLQSDPTDMPGDDPVDSLLDGSADLAVIESTHPFEDDIRVVLKLYQAVVHLSVSENFSQKNIATRGEPLRIEILQRSHTATLIADLLGKRSDIGAGGYVLWTEGDPGEPDIQFYLGPIDPERTDWFREGFRLVPLSRLDPAPAEFYIDGIRYLVPQLTTTRIPALTYTLPGNEEGIDALAVDMLLASHRRVDADRIYALTKTLVEQKPRFVAAAPALFRWLTVDFDDETLTHPLHRGARRFIDRDEPGFLERYAETLNFLLYMIALAVTATLAFRRWRARRRKERIDVFYQRVLDVRQSAGSLAPAATLSALDDIERDAYQALMDERLAADDSFHIYIELAAAVRREAERDPAVPLEGESEGESESGEG